ncbi:methyltransferase domain-containing protein [Heliobacterium gestii]|uniref:Methyltransferase domain-containing protein n=1 Tax=Heliomicrobium gestii TaxID=2699 RepID=A0A845LJH9_HELGE|nr:class I SAM-dependent methyltransferase [Heliomicrobium gestii]MBM7866694.1 SAM-dependent methyltransferase [Heliomicrobium gestii]MZP43026.1 methyltransferase domain-containing protein [Heliomicrobium gestii]
MTSQADFYKQEAFNPTSFDISDEETYRDHARKRMNLYVNRLKLPQALWKDRQVLEVGCASGENALVLAELGARFTFVEALQPFVDRLVALFRERKREHQISEIIVDEIQNVQLQDDAYDVIIAEGFLYTMPDRSAVLNQLVAALRPDGLFCLSTLDPVGNFAQYFRKVLLAQLCRQAGVTDLEGKLAIAEQLFGRDYAAIPHSRPFASWVRDNFLSPSYDRHCFWSIEEILKSVEGDVRVYSSWPRIEHANDNTWYKRVDSADGEMQSNLQAYTLRLPGYLHGQTLADGFPLPSMEEAARFSEAATKTMDALSAVLHGEGLTMDAAMPALDELALAAKALPDHDVLLPIIEDAKNIAREASIERYVQASRLRQCWGVGYPYYVLQKTR